MKKKEEKTILKLTSLPLYALNKRMWPPYKIRHQWWNEQST